jgi:Arc/MetJ-type ribon-helix-helix transcriptional regulator
MVKSIRDNHKRKRPGRPRTTGTTPMTGARLPTEMLSKIMAWAEAQDDKPNKAEAIRRLLQQALANSGSTRRLSPRAQAKAAEMAAKAIERGADPSATLEERESRKRRLLKGPKEFRGIRKDHSD